MVDGAGPLIGRNVIEFAPGMNVVFGRNGTGKSTLFKGMWAWSRAVDDVFALPSWTADATDNTGAWGDVARVIVDVDDGGEDCAGAWCLFLDDDEIAGLLGYGVGPWREGDDWIDALDIRFCRRISRMVGDELVRRNVVPALEWSDPGIVLVGLESSPTGLKTIVAIALALALRDVRSPRTPLIIDNGGLGLLDREHRWRVARELTGLEGQVILFTSVADVAQQLGIDWVLAPFRHARGIRARRYASSRQRFGV